MYCIVQRCTIYFKIYIKQQRAWLGINSRYFQKKKENIFLKNIYLQLLRTQMFLCLFYCCYIGNQNTFNIEIESNVNWWPHFCNICPRTSYSGIFHFLFDLSWDQTFGLFILSNFLYFQIFPLGYFIWIREPFEVSIDWPFKLVFSYF